MNNPFFRFAFLLLIFLALSGLSYLVLSFFPSELSFAEAVVIYSGSLFISFLSLFIFQRGIQDSQGKAVLHTLSSIGVKFLLFLALLGVFALVKKELSMHFILAFFASYLSFTVYLLITFFKILKSKKDSVSHENEK